MHTAELGGALVVLLGGWLLVSAATEPAQQPRLAALALFGGALGSVALPAARFMAEIAQSSTWVGAIAQLAARPLALLEPDQAALLVSAVGVTWLATAALVPSLGVGGCVLIALLNGGVVVPMVWVGLRVEDVRAVLTTLGAEGWWEGVSPLGWSGLLAGAVVLGWLVRAPRRAVGEQLPRLPVARVPWQGVAGVLMLLAGLALQERETLAASRFVSVGLGVVVAVLVAGGYTAFVTREPDTLSMARAALGSAFFALAAPTGASLAAHVAMGVVNGVLATVGYYVVNERLRLDDRHGVLVSVWASSLMGALLNVPEAMGGAADVASTSLVQAAGFAWVLLPAFGIHAVAAGFLRRQPGRVVTAPASTVEVPARAEEAREEQAVAPDERTATAEITLEQVVPERVQAMAQPPAYAEETEERAPTAQPQVAATPSAMEMPAAQGAVAVVSTETQPAAEERRRWWQFWRRPQSQKPSAPRRVARKVAYPRRVAGRALAVHPLAEETPTSLEDASAKERPMQ